MIGWFWKKWPFFIQNSIKNSRKFKINSKLKSKFPCFYRFWLKNWSFLLKNQGKMVLFSVFTVFLRRFLAFNSSLRSLALYLRGQFQALQVGEARSSLENPKGNVSLLYYTREFTHMLKTDLKTMGFLSNFHFYV